MRLALAVATSALMAWGMPGMSYAQGRCEALRPVTVNGLGIRITRLALQRELLVQFIVTNTTAQKAYVKSAQWGESGSAFLSSGTQIFTPVAVGVSTTQGSTGSSCMNNPSCYADLNTFSAVEPQGSTRFAYRFSSMTPMVPSDEISFTVALVARFARQTDQEGQAGAPRLLRFSFNSIPLDC